METYNVVVDYMTKFNILGVQVALFSSETSYGWQTCAEVEMSYTEPGINYSIVDATFHYLGNSYITLETAINVWQDLHRRILTQEEIVKVMSENDLIFNKNI